MAVNVPYRTQQLLDSQLLKYYLYIVMLRICQLSMLIGGYVQPQKKDKELFSFLAELQSNSGLWIGEVCLSVNLSVRLSTFWLTSTLKFVLSHVYEYQLDTMHVYRP